MANVDIEKFYAESQKRDGFSRDFHMRVLNIKLAGGIDLKGDTDLVYARTAKLPGRNIENKIVNYYGQQFNLPGKSSYPGSENYSIEFYCDGQLDLRNKLEEASRAVFDNETSTGQYGMPGEGDVITLQVIDKQLNGIETYDLIGASIREVGEIEYQIADGTGEVIKFTCGLSYHFYRVK